MSELNDSHDTPISLIQQYMMDIIEYLSYNINNKLVPKDTRVAYVKSLQYFLELAQSHSIVCIFVFILRC